MRIAEVAPLIESVPPEGYGGTEAVVSYLTEELVRQGHDVTLFASGDSKTSAELVPCAPSALRLDDGVIDPLAHQVVELEAVAAQAHRFDVIHWHLDYFHFPLSRRLGVPHATTLHGRLDIPDLQPVYTEFSEMPVVSISNDQRSPLPQANWVATIHHGLPPDVLEPRLRARRVPRLPRAHLPGEARRPGHRDRAPHRAHRSESRPRWTTRIASTTSSEIEPLLGAVARGVHRRDRSRREGRLPRTRQRAALPDRLGGAVRAGDDRVDGVRDAGRRLPDRLGAGGHHRRGQWVRRRRPRRRACEPCERLDELDRHAVRQSFEDRFTVDRMARDYIALFEHLVAVGGAIGPGRAAGDGRSGQRVGWARPQPGGRWRPNQTSSCHRPKIHAPSSRSRAATTSSRPARRRTRTPAS